MIPKPRFLNRYRWHYQTAQAVVCIAVVGGSWLIAGGALTGTRIADQLFGFERPAQAAVLTFFGLMVLALLVECEARGTERRHANRWVYDAFPPVVPYPDELESDLAHLTETDQRMRGNTER